MKVRRLEGMKVGRLEGLKVRRFEGGKVRRFEGVMRYEGVKDFAGAAQNFVCKLV